MTREEINKRIMQACKNMWNEKVCKEIEEYLEQEPILDKIRAEIEQIEINGYIRDVECFRAGINVALNVINKYRVESGGIK